MHLETVHTFLGNPAGKMGQAPSEAFLDSQVDERPVTNKATHRILSGNRLYLQHGPIDLVINADAPEYVQAQAYSLAIRRFETLLEELVAELPLLRTPWTKSFPEVQGSVARRMVDAVQDLGVFITPMAAVAGAVADEIRDVMLETKGLNRVMVNNGGDIAFGLRKGTQCQIGVVDLPDVPELFANVEIPFFSPVRGVATSGWRGRSLSLGIADAVTVLSKTSAQADAAATMVANAVNVEHPDIVRIPASQREDDSDLGDRLVTISVPQLSEKLIDEALEKGFRIAQTLIQADRIDAAYLSLQQKIRIVQNPESRTS